MKNPENQKIQEKMSGITQSLCTRPPIKIIHLAQAHNAPDISDRLANCVIQSQHGIARYIAAHPGTPVFREGLMDDSFNSSTYLHRQIPSLSDVSSSDFKGKLFPQGIPTKLEDLNKSQRTVLQYCGGDGLLHIIGKLKELYKASTKFFEDQGGYRAEQLDEITLLAGNDPILHTKRELIALEHIETLVKKRPEIKQVILVYGAAHDFSNELEIFETDLSFALERVDFSQCFWDLKKLEESPNFFMKKPIFEQCPLQKNTTCSVQDQFFTTNQKSIFFESLFSNTLMTNMTKSFALSFVQGFTKASGLSSKFLEPAIHAGMVMALYGPIALSIHVFLQGSLFVLNSSESSKPWSPIVSLSLFTITNLPYVSSTPIGALSLFLELSLSLGVAHFSKKLGEKVAMGINLNNFTALFFKTERTSSKTCRPVGSARNFRQTDLQIHQ